MRRRDRKDEPGGSLAELIHDVRRGDGNVGDGRLRERRRMVYGGHVADRLPHAHVIVSGAQSGHIADDLRLQRRDPPLMNLILAAGSVPTHGSGVSTGNVLEGFIVAGLLAHLLLQLRPSRRAVWKSRWEAVAPLLSVMGRDLIAVVTLPMTYIDMRRKAKRDLQTFHSDRDVYIPDEWERDVR